MISSVTDKTFLVIEEHDQSVVMTVVVCFGATHGVQQYTTEFRNSPLPGQ